MEGESKIWTTTTTIIIIIIFIITSSLFIRPHVKNSKHE